MELDCYNCGNAGHMARDCNTKTRVSLEKSSIDCYACGKVGHLSRSCTNVDKQLKESMDLSTIKCHLCGEQGHLKKDCTTNESQKPKFSFDLSIIKCFQCGEQGHLKKDCTTKESQRSSARNACFHCKEIGHLARDCSREKISNEKEAPSCFKCGNVGHISRSCPENENKLSKDQACFDCGSNNHIARDCFEKEKKIKTMSDCYKCGDLGHIARNCNNAKQIHGVDIDMIKHGAKKCFNCGIEGHVARECKSGLTPGGIKAGNLLCYNRGNLGHTYRECLGRNMDSFATLGDSRQTLSSDLRAKLSGPVDIISSSSLDTGKGSTSIELLQQELKKLENMLTGNMVATERKEADIGAIVETCNQNLNDCIVNLVNVSKTNYGNNENQNMIKSRLDSLRPLEMVLFKRLITRTDAQIKHTASLARLFPKLLAYIGFNYGELRATCIAYKIASPTGEGISKLASLFSEMLEGTEGTCKKIWPSMVSTKEVADILFTHFART